MRTKTIEYEGGFRLTIAPLSLEQVEKYVARKDEGGPAEGKLVREQVLELICDSLNNAFRNIRDPNGGERWTIEQARAELDLVTIGDLQEKILDFSGLKVKEPGESKAAAS